MLTEMISKKITNICMKSLNTLPPSNWSVKSVRRYWGVQEIRGVVLSWGTSVAVSLLCLVNVWQARLQNLIFLLCEMLHAVICTCESHYVVCLGQQHWQSLGICGKWRISGPSQKHWIWGCVVCSRSLWDFIVHSSLRSTDRHFTDWKTEVQLQRTGYIYTDLCEHIKILHYPYCIRAILHRLAMYLLPSKCSIK